MWVSAIPFSGMTVRTPELKVCICLFHAQVSFVFGGGRVVGRGWKACGCLGHVRQLYK